MFFLLFSNNGMNNGQLSSAISWHREQSASIENNQLFVVRTILPWQWMEITLFIACVYLVVNADSGRYNTFARTTAHNDCRPESYLVTRTRFFLVMCLSIICIVYVSLLLLAGDRVKS